MKMGSQTLGIIWDHCKDDIVSSYRSMICLLLVWNLMIVIIVDRIYGHLDQQDLLPEEQRMQKNIKRCH